jgi:hypothetical protein
MQTIRERKYNSDGTRQDTNPLTRQIIGVDSEGWNIPLSPGVKSVNPHVSDRGWHSDVMLVAADDKDYRKILLHDASRRERTVTQARNYGLPTVKAIEFLLNLPKDALIVGFYFSYDVTKLFADLPLANMLELCDEGIIEQENYEHRVKAIHAEYELTLDYIHSARLVAPATTIYEGYWIHYTQRKELVIKDLKAGRHKVRDKFRDAKTGLSRLGKPEWEWAREVIIWDVYTFFQASFVKALGNYRCGQCEGCIKTRNGESTHCQKALWTLADLERIEQMKLHRGAFEASEQDAIVNYCIDECRYLSFLVRDLLTQIDSFGLKLTRFDGSGAVASAWMKQNNIKDYLPSREIIAEIDDIPVFSLAGLPEYIALCAYFGGRFEISEIGYMGTLYGYDINSAYPFITVNLPCLVHGHFEQVSNYQPGKIGVYLAGSQTSGRYAPFPFRTDSDNKEIARDAIYYCHGGKRWIWHKELEIARKHFGTVAIPVYDGWIWISDECSCNPFKDIPYMYKQRQEYVIQGNGIEKVIKLILNSLYGKTAQSIGWSISKSGIKNPPPFQCFIWAGLITSGCRAMILDAIMQPDADVVSIATDGILSRTPITAIPAPKEKILGAWDSNVVTDGYLFQSGVYTYINEKGKRKYATRGFSSREISAEQLIAAYMNDNDTVSANPTESRFVPMKAGKDRDNALEYIGQWVPSEHDVTLTHNRRLPKFADNTDVGAFIRESEPHVISDDMLSAPYTPKQTWEQVMENQPVSDEADLADYQEIR